MARFLKEMVKIFERSKNKKDMSGVKGVGFLTRLFVTQVLLTFLSLFHLCFVPVFFSPFVLYLILAFQLLVS